MSGGAREVALTRLSVERTLSVIEQALRRRGSQLLEQESTRTVARMKAEGLSPGYDILVSVERSERSFYEQSRFVMVAEGRPGTTPFDPAIITRDLRTIVQDIEQIVDDAFPEGWTPAGEPWISSGALLVGDPTNLSAAARIEGISPDVYTFYTQELQRSSEFGPFLDKIRLSIRPGPIDRRVVLGTIPLRFPGNGAGIAVVLDEGFFKEHWDTVHHCEEIVKQALFGGATGLVDPKSQHMVGFGIVFYSIPIDLSEAIELHRFHAVLNAVMSQETIGNNNVILTMEQLYGAGELRGIELRF
jgi:hypothetical protein